MPDEPPCLAAALTYAQRGWPVFPCKPRSKEPGTAHGVKDASTNPDRIRRMFGRHNDPNVAVATGAPGPQGFDVDDLVNGHDALILVEALGGPEAATARGRTLYLRGSERGTIGLEYGELRGVGSYVIAPPSIHPTGKEYVWLNPPSDAPLPRVPEGLVPAERGTAGTGELEPVELIPFGRRHEALKDFAIRQLRAGITDVPTLVLTLQSFFAARCDLSPAPRKDEFKQIATWAAKTHIANRERAFADYEEEKPKKSRRRATGLERQPRGDAPLAEHRAFVAIAGGWGDRIDIASVRRFGPRGVDALEIKLTNGQLIEFEHQEQITTRGHWARTVTMHTNGIARPVAMNELEALAVLRSLCILGDAPSWLSATENMREAVKDFVAMAAVWDEHDLSTPTGRYDAIRRAQAHDEWQPRLADDEHQPIVIADRADGRQHVRSSEVFAHVNYRGLKMPPLALPGRMAMIDAERWVCRGHRTEPGRKDRDSRRMVLYRLAAAEDDES